MNYKKLIFTLLITFISAINCGPKKDISTVQYSALRERMLDNPALANDSRFKKEWKRARTERLEKQQAKARSLKEAEQRQAAHDNLVSAIKPLSAQKYLFLQAMLGYAE